jgi:hypothetical protein
MAGRAEGQKERYSRAFIVAAAASASEEFTYAMYPDDIEGVDMTIRHKGVSLDFQLKATAHPEERNGYLFFDLDVPTYAKLADDVRGGLAVLGLVVVHPETTQWVRMGEKETTLAHCAYYLILTGMPNTKNSSKIRLRIPTTNVLTPDAMATLMSKARARLAG